MSLNTVLQIVLSISIIAMIAFVIVVLNQMRKTLLSVDDLAKSVNSELIPLIIKAQITLEEVNTELERVDGIVTSFKEVSDKVQNSTDIAKGVAKKVVSTPAMGLAGVVSGARAVLGNIVSRRGK